MVKKFCWALILLTGFLLLNGCSSISRNDGPPSYHVDASKIPDAVPKIEKLSKYGNPEYYWVFGKRYATMRSSQNYEAQGIASWYGTKFHKRHTSSGERYDMLAMTAAHRSLPLPTYVQVTNLSNGKQVIVKVNDRGPFESNRLIDLSYVAAKKLGMIGHGTAYVDVKAIDPRRPIRDEEVVARNNSFNLGEPSSPIRTTHIALDHHRIAKTHHYAQNIQSKKVYLQVGAFKNKLYAERLRERLRLVVSEPIYITRLSHTSKHLYHVQIGPINNVARMNHISKKLKSLRLTCKKTDRMEV